MVLTDEMKHVISKRMMNGSMMLYLFVSAWCIIKGFTSLGQGRVPVMFVFGVALFLWACYPRIRFKLDVEKDNITITRATVVDKYKRPHGKRRVFLILQTEAGEQRKMHPLARIYNETNIGDEGIYVKNKCMESFFFMREFNM
ncbi:MAG: hypothetical protein IJA10_13945 [Lachnospiraceae bacterium]|nr:hypothetical protein [Lachnospiraceae bacterium]